MEKREHYATRSDTLLVSYTSLNIVRIGIQHTLIKIKYMEDLDLKTIIFRLTGRHVPGPEYDIEVYPREIWSAECKFSDSVNIS
jgi:hypothetical protein